MNRYSEFFETLYDETGPTGNLGRGTHYSVLRAVVFHDPMGTPLPKGQNLDFAVIWDQDHDVRVIKVVEEIYRLGLLPGFQMFGESLGFFTAIFSKQITSMIEEENLLDFKSTPRLRLLKDEVGKICNPWFPEFEVLGTADRQRGPLEKDLELKGSSSIVYDEDDEKVDLYLKNLDMLWRLGPAETPPVLKGHQLIPGESDLAALQ